MHSYVQENLHFVAELSHVFFAPKRAGTGTVLGHVSSLNLAAFEANEVLYMIKAFSLTYDLEKSILHNLAVIRLTTLWNGTAPLLS